MMSENRAISFMQSVGRIKRRWSHLTKPQKQILLSLIITADDLSEKFVIRNIAKVRRQKVEVV